MKRAFDCITALLAMIVLSPVIAIIATSVRLFLGTPILFKQRRPGMNAAPFVILKFRTMRDTADGTGAFLSDNQRLTPFGRFLRSSSLDELPELWNVLKGEMSLVGPRPLLMEYLPRYSPEQSRRHEVRPGITGWAQVNGRNALSWEDKFKLDIWYVDHQSFWLDLKILALTVVSVVARRNISAAGHATMPVFLPERDATRDATGRAP